MILTGQLSAFSGVQAREWGLLLSQESMILAEGGKYEPHAILDSQLHSHVKKTCVSIDEEEISWRDTSVEMERRLKVEADAITTRWRCDDQERLLSDLLRARSECSQRRTEVAAESLFKTGGQLQPLQLRALISGMLASLCMTRATLSLSEASGASVCGAKPPETFVPAPVSTNLLRHFLSQASPAAGEGASSDSLRRDRVCATAGEILTSPDLLAHGLIDGLDLRPPLPLFSCSPDKLPTSPPVSSFRILSVNRFYILLAAVGCALLRRAELLVGWHAVHVSGQQPLTLAFRTKSFGGSISPLPPFALRR